MVGFALVKWLIISAILWSTSPLTFTKLLQGSQNSKPWLTSKWTNYQGEPTIGWDDALSALLIGCCCAASIIWISFPPIWFTMILSILHYLVQVLQKMVKFSYIGLYPICYFSENYIPILFLWLYSVCGFKDTYLFVHRTMLHRMARVEYPCHYPQGPENKM